MFKGSIVAIVTPFKDGKLDEKTLEALVAWHIEQGTDGLVPCGTTGESPTLSEAEHKRVVDICVAGAKGKIPVIAGAGSNSTDHAIHLAKLAKTAGADAILVVTPYYNKPTQEGLFRHFKAIHDATDLPLVIYNIPGRSIVDMTVETMARLAKLPHIVGVKDATSDLVRPIRTRLAIGSEFCQLSGEDGTAIPFLAAGGHGCISVTANVAPKLCADMQRAWRNGDLKTASALQDKLTPLHSSLFCETSPGPVKYAMSLIGKCSAEVRLPLCEIAEASKQRVQAAIAQVGLAR